jgi:hypothetical protein
MSTSEDMKLLVLLDTISLLKLLLETQMLMLKPDTISSLIISITMMNIAPMSLKRLFAKTISECVIQKEYTHNIILTVIVLLMHVETNHASESYVKLLSLEPTAVPLSKLSAYLH